MLSDKTDSAPLRGRKLLLVSGLQVYPTISGGTIRTFALANALRHHGFEVFVYSLSGRKKDYLARRPSAIQRWPGGIEEHVERTLPSAAAWVAGYGLGLPPIWITCHLAAAAALSERALLPRLLLERLAWCDVVLADFPFPYPILSVNAASGKLRVVNTHNVEHHLCDAESGWFNRGLRKLIRHIEIRAAETSHLLVCCSVEDGRFFAAHSPRQEPILVPNGIDVRRLRDVQSTRAEARRDLGFGDNVRLFLFTGSKWGPNREALDYLLVFARNNGAFLTDRGIHVVVVGGVAARPISLPGFSATGRVDAVEPYFAAADAALNPIVTGAGTNVKMCEFIALRLPLVTTSFGARGLSIEDGRTGFLFERDGLAPVLSTVRRLFDEDPARLRAMAEEAYLRNEQAVDMDACVRGLVDAIAGTKSAALPHRATPTQTSAAPDYPPEDPRRDASP